MATHPLLEQAIKDKIDESPEAQKILNDETQEKKGSIRDLTKWDGALPPYIKPVVDYSIGYWRNYFGNWDKERKSRKDRIRYKKDLIKQLKEQQKKLKGGGKKQKTWHGRTIGSIFRDAFLGPVGWIHLGVDIHKAKQEEKLDRELKELLQGHTRGRARETVEETVASEPTETAGGQLIRPDYYYRDVHPGIVGGPGSINPRYREKLRQEQMEKLREHLDKYRLRQGFRPRFIK